jgi:hypothetical protein
MNQTKLRWLFLLTISKFLKGLPPEFEAKGRQFLKGRPIKMVSIYPDTQSKRSFDRNILLQRSPELMTVPYANNWFVVPRTYKFIKLAPEVLGILEQFNCPTSLDEAIPNGNDKVLSTVCALIDTGVLVRHEVDCLITGCGRSGTSYISNLLTSLGLDIGHETMGKDGIASWLLAVNTDLVPWGPPPKLFTFKTVIHQIRNPLDTISSLQTFSDIAWQFICNHIPASHDEPLLLKCAKYWHYWNLSTERVAQWSYRIEDINEVFDELCFRVGVPANRGILRITPTDVNTRKQQYRKVSWKDIAAIDRNLALAIQEQSVRYGYLL